MQTRTFNYNPVDSFRKPLSYVIQKRRGYTYELQKFDSEDVKRLKSSEFIKTNNSPKGDTFEATEFSDDYYRTIYGLIDWSYQKIKGFIKSKLG